jgi:hypothetical protein
MPNGVWRKGTADVTNNEQMILKAAAALANARGMRRGVPSMTNILDVLKGGKLRDLYDEVVDEATQALDAIAATEMLDVLQQLVAYADNGNFELGEGEEATFSRARAIVKAVGRP